MYFFVSTVVRPSFSLVKPSLSEAVLSRQGDRSIRLEIATLDFALCRDPFAASTHCLDDHLIGLRLRSEGGCHCYHAGQRRDRWDPHSLLLEVQFWAPHAGVRYPYVSPVSRVGT